MASDKPVITFYDIASGPPLRTFAPNPWKVRYALNLKKLSYQTQWVDMPDISSVREKLVVPANRTHRDGTPYHTLPVIQDHSTGQVVGDSFEIALYLDKTYPSTPALIPPRTTGLTAAFNSHVDGLFTKHVALCDQMPFHGHPREEEIKGVFLKRWGASSWDDLTLSGAVREQLFQQFERALSEFVKAYRHVGGTTDYIIHPEGTAAAQAQKQGREEVGPYLDGDEPTYADLIVGAWLAMFAESLGAKEWQQVREWDDGFWGRLHDALEPLRTIK